MGVEVRETNFDLSCHFIFRRFKSEVQQVSIDGMAE
jgi:hypothetical protein